MAPPAACKGWRVLTKCVALRWLLAQNVVVVGYPTGGDNTSVTSGVVSRVEVAQYVHSASHLMAIQIDAAINAGNSGESPCARVGVAVARPCGPHPPSALRPP